jgi:hypothetical protein
MNEQVHYFTAVVSKETLSVGGSRECSYKHLGFIRGREFPDYLGNYQLVVKNPDLLSCTEATDGVHMEVWNDCA